MHPLPLFNNFFFVKRNTNMVTFKKTSAIKLIVEINFKYAIECLDTTFKREDGFNDIKLLVNKMLSII